VNPHPSPSVPAHESKSDVSGEEARPPHEPPYQVSSIEAVKSLGLNGLTLALTPALSPGERENPFPRPANMGALDWRWFRGSKREIFVWENSHPGLLPQGEGDTVSASCHDLHARLAMVQGFNARSCSGNSLPLEGRGRPGFRVGRYPSERLAVALDSKGESSGAATRRPEVKSYGRTWRRGAWARTRCSWGA